MRTKKRTKSRTSFHFHPPKIISNFGSNSEFFPLPLRLRRNAYIVCTGKRWKICLISAYYFSNNIFWKKIAFLLKIQQLVRQRFYDFCTLPSMLLTFSAALHAEIHALIFCEKRDLPSGTSNIKIMQSRSALRCR